MFRPSPTSEVYSDDVEAVRMSINLPHRPKVTIESPNDLSSPASGHQPLPRQRPTGPAAWSIFSSEGALQKGEGVALSHGPLLRRASFRYLGSQRTEEMRRELLRQSASPGATAADGQHDEAPESEPPEGVVSLERPVFIDHARYLGLLDQPTKPTPDEESCRLEHQAHSAIALFRLSGQSEASKLFHSDYIRQIEASHKFLSEPSDERDVFHLDKASNDKAVARYIARVLEPPPWTLPLASGSRYCVDDTCTGACPRLREQEAVELHPDSHRTSNDNVRPVEHGHEVGSFLSDPPAYRRRIFLHVEAAHYNEVSLRFYMSPLTGLNEWYSAAKLCIPVDLKDIVWKEYGPYGISSSDGMAAAHHGLLDKGLLPHSVTSLQDFVNRIRPVELDALSVYRETVAATHPTPTRPPEGETSSPLGHDYQSAATTPLHTATI